mgnify:CR=1 FL=1
MDKLTVIVPAAGAGKRLGLGKNKVFAMLGGLPLLVQCLRMITIPVWRTKPLSPQVQLKLTI